MENMKYWEKKEVVRSLRSSGLSYREIRHKLSFSIKVQVCDKNLLCKILGWIEGVIKKGRATSSMVVAGHS